MDPYSMVWTALDVLSVVGTSLVMLAAFVAAIVMTMRKLSPVGGWLLALARTGMWVVSLGYLLVDVVLMRTYGFETVQWLMVTLKVLMILSAITVAVALLLIKPSKDPGQAEREVANG